MTGYYDDENQWKQDIQDLIDYPFADGVLQDEKDAFRMREYKKMSLGRLLELNKLARSRGWPEMLIPDDWLAK